MINIKKIMIINSNEYTIDYSITNVYTVKFHEVLGIWDF